MKQTYFYGAMALGLLFSACSSDDILNEPNDQPLEADQTFYVNMTIHGEGNGTRSSSTDGSPVDDATDFVAGVDDGTYQESKINNAYFVFYDKDGLVVGDIVPVELNSATSTTGTNGTVETVYKSIVGISVRKGENPPTGVICYINPVSPSSLQTTLRQIQTVTRDRVTTQTSDGKIIFPMSNSVYYPVVSPATTPAPTALPQIVVPIDKDTQLYTTEAAASEATAKAIDIYVERYATKLTFSVGTEVNNNNYETRSRVLSVNETDGTVTPNDVKVELKFVPDKWALNGESNSSYVVKSFHREATDGQILAANYEYGLLDYRINPTDPENVVISDTPGTVMNNGWTWNNASFHRSYWGMSPAYFQSEYPVVAGDVNKTETNQTYLTFKQILDNNDIGYAATDNSAKYFKETTVGNKALNGGNPAAAVASVVYLGHYELTINNNTVSNTNFYTYLKGNVTISGKQELRPFVYFESDATGESAVAGGESMLKRFCAQSTILFTNIGSDDDPVIEELGIEKSAYYTKMRSCLQVVAPTKEVKEAVSTIGTGTTEGDDENTALKLQANAVSLQIISAQAAQNAGLLIASGNGYKTIVADDVAETPEVKDEDGNITQRGTIHLSRANAILMQQVGFAYKYTSGNGYFNIPVRHLGWYRAGNPNKPKADGTVPEFNWNLVRVGDFGMVRNHTYNIKVNSITGLASGMGGENDFIIPPASTQDYYVSYAVNILKWAVVPTQEVNL